ncbi:site-2 protease family protein [Chitinimonas koreensis]|uniref:site-2 protease family protein n=1 Tax=Chitinimonas koreensis TaxID=356302 RepID=UPI0003FAEF59|nr:site-2 protease family protein [Chitinimonas koreensis]QNM98051.1 site-2 protease family protein [Chitinimonas koreensis]
MQALLEVLTLYALPVIFALTIPEAAQAMVADKLGDRSARASGRLTLNPTVHIDPLGTIILPLGMIALTKLSGGVVPPLLIGWAKPIPIDYGRLSNPKRAMRWLAAAIPAANLAMALVWAVFFKLAAVNADSYFAEPLQRMAAIGITMNLAFAVLMLLPILPFPGGRIVFSLLPPRAAFSYAKHEPYGNWIVLGLFITGILGVVLGPIIQLLVALIATLFGL